MLKRMGERRVVGKEGRIGGRNKEKGKVIIFFKYVHDLRTSIIFLFFFNMNNTFSIQVKFAPLELRSQSAPAVQLIVSPAVRCVFRCVKKAVDVR